MKSVEERFWGKVDRKSSDECWEWKGAKLRGGYGNIRINRVNVQAHRYSYIIHIGEIPMGMHVLHKCDNPACVNPKHLFLGDNFINSQDRVNKDRQIKGEKHPHSKLVDNQVLRLRELYSSGQFSMHKLAKLFGMSYSETNAILHRKTWKHI